MALVRPGAQYRQDPQVRNGSLRTGTGMTSPGIAQIEKNEEHNFIVSKSPIRYTLTVQNHVFRQSRWAVLNCEKQEITVYYLLLYIVLLGS